MNKFLHTLLLLVIHNACFAQHLEDSYPDTLFCPDDTLRFQYIGQDFYHKITISKTKQTSPGTDSAPGEYVMLFYGKDSLKLKYTNKLPYSQRTTVHVKSPKGYTKALFRYNDAMCYFSDEYKKKNYKNIQFDIPEVYELANIIWVLSPGGQRATDLRKEDDYYKKVVEWFQPYANHPIVKQLDFPDSLYFQNYYLFRENSFTFSFKNARSNELQCVAPYYVVYGDGVADSNYFGKLKPLVQDFAIKSKFRQFYKQHEAFYKKAIEREKALLPVRPMWTWLEKEFPQRFSSYRIVFSPLIGGSHSTQNFSRWAKPEPFRETVMFVCGTDRYDKVDSLTEKQREGLMSGIVFTEIDHNYVNPTTWKYEKKLDTVFSKQELWVTRAYGNRDYKSNSAVFNEYMTHALFCLYVQESYDKAVADFIIQNREKLMVDKRNFIRFKEFNRELMRLRQANPNKKVTELYPAILEWCGQQQL